MKEENYRIDGKADPKILQELPKELRLRVYAVRDRRVLGSSPIARDGSFTIKYKYEVFVKGEKRLAIGPSLVAGPDLPGDAILKTKSPAVFLQPEQFAEKEGEWRSTVPAATIDKIISKSTLEEVIVPWWEVSSFEWRPCVQVWACSKIEAGLCQDQQPLENALVRIYQLRQWTGIGVYHGHPVGVTAPPPLAPGTKYKVLMAEGDTDVSGCFKITTRISRIFYGYTPLGYLVEVDQKINGMFNLIYRDPDDQPHELASDVCYQVYVDESKVNVVNPPPNKYTGPTTGNTFELTHIGDIPVNYIDNRGYANTPSPSTPPVPEGLVDCAFYDTINIYANIGWGIKDTVRYYRIRYSYEQADGTVIDSYLRVPFDNLRESTPAERQTYGPYVTKSMRQAEPNTDIYEYPNPYDPDPEKNWVFKGLVMVLDTATLPSPVKDGKFTFALEALDNNMKPFAHQSPNPNLNLDNPDNERKCTIVVDNTAPIGSIGQIIGRAPSGSTSTAVACGFLTLDPAGSEMSCTVPPTIRQKVSGEISVPFSAEDALGHIQSLLLQAHFGDVCDSPVTLVGDGRKPTVGYGGPTEYQNYNDVLANPGPSGQPPFWWGRGDLGYCGSLFKPDWHECAYQFRLTIYKRVTNGERSGTYPWWDFEKHITITHT
jgi:hypothetical protein